MSKRAHLPPELLQRYEIEKGAIQLRLLDYARVPVSEWFYEFCFCICTPQSSALHADAAVNELKHLNYQQDGGDVLHILRDPSHYIRFHNVKHVRLQQLRLQWPEIEELVSRTDLDPRDKRNKVAELVSGFGLKEASHALRNIGLRGLAIIDRHLITNLVRCGVIDQVPALGKASNYHDIEERFNHFCNEIGIDMDEIDLLFWSEQTGHIFK